MRSEAASDAPLAFAWRLDIVCEGIGGRSVAVTVVPRHLTQHEAIKAAVKKARERQSAGDEVEVFLWTGQDEDPHRVPFG